MNRPNHIRQSREGLLESCLEEMLRYVTAERDDFYECASTASGLIPDQLDRAELARMDALIDRARALLGYPKPAALRLGECLDQAGLEDDE